MDIKARMQELTNELLRYQEAYYVEGKSLVSDLEYDGLFDELSKLEKEHPEYASSSSPTQRVGSDLTSDFPEVKHTIPVLSLDKAYSVEEVLSFMGKCEEKGKEKLSFVEEEKIDGISMVLYYEDGILVRGVTRGNGSVGNDVTANIKTINQIPLRLKEKVNLVVRGEVYLAKADFLKFKDLDGAANPRNLAAGSVRRQKSSETAQIPLQIFIYEGFWEDESKTPQDHISILAKLKELGFRINPHLALFSSSKEKSENMLKTAGLEGKAYSFDSLGSYIKDVTQKRQDLEYEIDGMVTKINELDVRKELGYTQHHPRWAIAYKFESPQAETIINGITMQVGRTGRITPVAELNPVALGGSTVKRATLHNQEYIDELEIAIGDKVSVVKRGDVIPAVEEVLEKNEEGNTTFKIPHICPCCNTPLEEKGAHLFCPNPECPDQVLGRIAFFASRECMDMESFGPKSVEVLIKHGFIKDIPDLYTFNYDKILDENIKGLGEKTVNQFKVAVKESKKKPFRVVLTSLGLPEVGKKGAEILIKGGFDSIDKLIQASLNKDIEAFTKIPQIGEQTATLIINALNDKVLLERIEKLKSAGLQFEENHEENSLEQIFAGQVWCVTGSFEHYNPRSLALAEIEKRGGRTTSSVTSKTTHLLLGKGGGSKRATAESLGVKLVDEGEFLKMIGEGEVKTESAPEDGQLSLF
ncbi:MAG: NAD-dependent DNA ligase LigA [Spirochaetales bacterium]|uniref:NAD-dependent DNA ligase LigA n=1 Tax=Bullifex sp. TaxID=2815808 RepID=UPI002A539470|nr:NAD-dependent DNA ligase LigA [Bullifex sp.]MDD5973375.1 NAD-dependent DNA ligase LigA [Spirochaetales bacterium]MDD7272302.1 NAD-dependent DNA ligase LigA [Spirochaetales bacterium]MDY4067751.1 NAD-dependent DNA ligase LigA [Bullifex sp.]